MPWARRSWAWTEPTQVIAVRPSAQEIAVRLLDTVVLNFRSGEQLIIHALPNRRQYWNLLPRPNALSWR